MGDKSQAGAKVARRGPGGDWREVENWRKASYSQSNGHCVEVARLADGRIGVRDSKAVPGECILRFEPGAWAAFLGTLQGG